MGTKTSFNPRDMMERAIKVMRESVTEPRKDDKESPKVGAVLCKPDGTVETACRGDLRYGDHAEFSLLERKNRGARLDNAVLFVTLEPCAPGSRHDPKLSCAERIYLARVKTVWVGIQDPDPNVARKGIEYLNQQGVEVHMFDRDFQEVIEDENREFLNQALERATKAEKKPPEIVLSPYESMLPAAALEDFSNKALETYRKRAGISDTVASRAFQRRLRQQGLLQEDQGKLVPTGFGILLFGKEPRTAMQQAGLLATLEYPNGDRERREFDDAAVIIPDLLEDWLKNKLPNVFDRDQMERQQRPPLPFEMVREAVVNALIHRDYSIEGAKCQIVVTKDTVTVRSPGEPPPPITFQQLQEFAAPMLSRNPELHFVFARMGMAEEQGLGLSSFRERAQELGLPLPHYTWEDPYLVLTIYRSPEGPLRSLSSETQKSLNKSELKGWQWLCSHGKASSREYADAMGIGVRTARRHLNDFERLGLVGKVGSGPTLEYEVI